ncbi:ABC transporter i family member 19 [Phtheirospermum japonicum]|uniref:ABC transporter i family member 19 n=1 Tax=Phtheirospermum japonicum TaxID=374723 RepID=A0A830B7E5_9LAMI|nr:ABC transporter i family member 19 [Phtheirospermum japonicum]
MADELYSIQVSGMQFSYDAQSPLFFDFNLNISRGSRCLLLGANGSGKTSLLRILAGKHLVGGKDVVRVLVEGVDPARRDNLIELLDIDLHWRMHKVSDGQRRRVQICMGLLHPYKGDLPLQGDFSAEHMIFGVEGVDPARRDNLIELLDIDLHWRMHKVSDGQRRRVQICMGLLHPYKVLLLDEVTVDLDVVARMDLLDFFKEECEQRGATIVYATHIFDGLETWATDLVYVQDGMLKRTDKLAELQELKNKMNLLSVVESWLRSETKIEKKKPVSNPPQNKTSSPFDASPFRSSRHMAYYR